MSDLIRRSDAMGAVQDHFNADGFKGYDDGQQMMDRIKALPSEEAKDRLYIKIYADDEPSVKAEKLYQICGETENREVSGWLKEYFPSDEDYDYERAVDQMNHDVVYEPTYNPEDGSI